MSESFTLNVGDHAALDLPLAANQAVSFRSRTLDSTPDPNVMDNTSLNLLSSDGDYLLHISFRRPSKMVVMNSREVTKGWSTEITFSYEGLFKDGPAVVAAWEYSDHFDVIINNTGRHTFAKRIRQPVKAVSYEVNDGMTTSFFASTIDVYFDSTPPPPNSYERAYFQLTGAEVAREAESQPFDIVIIGSGIGGGVLVASLLEKNRLLTQSVFGQESIPDDPREMSQKPAIIKDGPQPLRILVVEKGGLLFHTHCLNGPRPSISGTTSQGNDFFFKTFKHQFDIVDKTKEGWVGGPVFCVGGRAAVWGLFSPRVSINTLHSEFPPEVCKALLNEYYRKAEEMMKIAYPTTLLPHQALMDRLNLRTSTDLPVAQWEWGRVASEFRDPKNYDFAEGAFSTIDKLLEAAMNDPTGAKDQNFRTVSNIPVVRLEPAPQPNQQTEVTHVVIQDGPLQRKIACKRAVICAGSVESPAILLRSAGGDPSRYGDKFAKAFGHVTDHRILSVASLFSYRNLADRDVIGSMKLQTNIQFNIQRDGKTVDNTTALANISLDSTSFLPREDVPDGNLPVLTITYIIPSDLAPENKIELNARDEPRITVGWAEDKYLEDKKQVLKNFAVDIMNKMVAVFDVCFATATDNGYSPILHEITVDDVELKTAGPGVVAHELGSIPMPHKDGSGGILNSDLEMQYGWKNVSVCDLSVFPYSPAANPSLTLAALALRLSDKLFPDPKYSPIIVYNLTGSDVVVNISNSKPESPSFGPKDPVKIASGGSETWKISQREVMYIYSCTHAESYDIQMVYPGVNAMIVTSPPAEASCNCCTARTKGGKSEL